MAVGILLASEQVDADLSQAGLIGKRLTIARSSGSLTFPADFMLIAAQNPCPCGYHNDPVKE
jgi:magnesium chelatase family protein